MCANDYPVGVLPAGTTNEQAQALRNKMREEDPANIEHRKQYPGDSGWRVYYHVHEVPELTL